MILEQENAVSTWGQLAAKPCDACKASPAILFCRSHTAYLCGACDSNIHASSTDKHERVWLCEVCEQSPADFTCKADAAALCSSCDLHIHSANPLASRHERLPVLPFFRTLFATNTCTEDEWPVSNPDQGELLGTESLHSDLCSFLDFGTPIDFADLKYHIPSARSYGADSVVPTQTKSIDYLDSFSGRETCFEIDFSRSNLSQFNHSSQCISQSGSSSEAGVVPDGSSSSMSEVSNSSGPQPLQISGMDRKARVMRYREKKKNRKFQKTIRYASRKAYAERRPRIKGRFAKRIDGEVDVIYSAANLGVFTVDQGVVSLD